MLNSLCVQMHLYFNLVAFVFGECTRWPNPDKTDVQLRVFNTTHNQLWLFHSTWLLKRIRNSWHYTLSDESAAEFKQNGKTIRTRSEASVLLENIRFWILTAVNIKITVFWNVKACSPVRLRRQSKKEDVGSRFFRNVGSYLPDYRAIFQKNHCLAPSVTWLDNSRIFPTRLRQRLRRLSAFPPPPSLHLTNCRQGRLKLLPWLGWDTREDTTPSFCETGKCTGKVSSEMHFVLFISEIDLLLLKCVR